MTDNFSVYFSQRRITCRVRQDRSFFELACEQAYTYAYKHAHKKRAHTLHADTDTYMYTSFRAPYIPMLVPWLASSGKKEVII